MKRIEEIDVQKVDPGYGYVNIEFDDINKGFVIQKNCGTEPIELPDGIQCITFSSDLMDAEKLRELRNKFEIAINKIDWCLQESNGTPI